MSKVTSVLVLVSVKIMLRVLNFCCRYLRRRRIRRLILILHMFAASFLSAHMVFLFHLSKNRLYLKFAFAGKIVSLACFDRDLTLSSLDVEYYLQACLSQRPDEEIRVRMSA